MSEPRLTIGIPHLDRWENLQDAIREAMSQQLPVRVIVADQGRVPETAEVCKEWEDHPHFERFESPATNLWENWRFIAEKADEGGAEFFTWLQDDDYLSERFSRRVVRAFDHFTDADVYCSSLAMSYDGWLGWNHLRSWGPKIPVDIRQGKPAAWPGTLLVLAGYFDSWCMSPAKSFRVNDQFRYMLHTLPAECDCLTERLDVAVCAHQSKFIVDPKTSGCWQIHHGPDGRVRNESQTTGPKQAAQFGRAFEYLDVLMDEITDWRQELAGWMSLAAGTGLIQTYHKQLRPHRHKSPYALQIFEMFDGAMRASGIKIEPEVVEQSADVNGHCVTA